MNNSHPECEVEFRGTVSLPEIEDYMHKLREQRLAGEISDRLLVLTHPPSLALGARKLNPEDLLQPLADFEKDGIYLYQATRGGGLTFHWPGQLVVYPVLKLAKHEQSLPKYMQHLEEVGIRTLHDLGIEAYRRRDQAAQIGLWHEGKKIASMGIFVARWITSFGFALNLEGDLSPAQKIRPCGLKNVELVTIEQVTGQAPGRIEVNELVLKHFQEIFERELIPLF